MQCRGLGSRLGYFLGREEEMIVPANDHTHFHDAMAKLKSGFRGWVIGGCGGEGFGVGHFPHENTQVCRAKPYRDVLDILSSHNCPCQLESQVKCRVPGPSPRRLNSPRQLNAENQPVGLRCNILAGSGVGV